jgi:cell fate regulator YaaT (PSP1 superfamily)
MKVSLKIFPWDSSYIYDSGSWNLKVGDVVIISTDFGTESALVEDVGVEAEGEAPKIIRKANLIDLEIVERNKEKNKEAVRISRDLVKEAGLPMKIIDAHFSFDGGRVTFPFIAEKRIDFRELVKALSRKFQRSIRLQQVGSRDEARKRGGFGVCGRELCCIKFPGDLKSVTTDDTKLQQMEQRGSEKLSGLCGRLKCCLGFESEQYREALEDMPEIGETVKVDGKEGMVVDRNILLKEVVIEFKDKNKERMHISRLK